MNIILKNMCAIAIVFLSFSLTLKSMEVAWPKLPKKEFLVDRSKYPHLKEEAIYRKNIFEWLTGRTEESLVDYYKAFNKLPELPSATQTLMNNLKHEKFTLSELRKSVADKFTSSNGKLSILYLDVMKHPEKRHLIDIGALQAKHDGALFQTASRTSALEGAQMIYQENKEQTDSEHAFSYTHNGFFGIIGSSAVQGEEAAISCAIKAIYQIYMVDKNIYLFEKIGIKTNPRGRITGVDTDLLKKANPDNLSDNICVRFWQNVPVLTGCSNVLHQVQTIKQGVDEGKHFGSDMRGKNREDANMLVTDPCFISHVNVSAVELSEDGKDIKGFGKNRKLAEKTAKAALKAAYEATIYAAIKDKKTKVFLTLVGCGAFRNKLEWVADILANMTDIITQSGLDITLVAMDANGHLSDKQKVAWDKIKSIAQKTRGTITDVSKPEKPVMNAGFFSILPSFLRHNILLSIGGGLSFIGLLYALKYYYEKNPTAAT